MKRINHRLLVLPAFVLLLAHPACGKTDGPTARDLWGVRARRRA
jgi:hypothetical protein